MLVLSTIPHTKIKTNFDLLLGDFHFLLGVPVGDLGVLLGFPTVSWLPIQPATGYPDARRLSKREGV